MCWAPPRTPPAPGPVVMSVMHTDGPPVGESSVAAAPVLYLSLGSPSPQQRDMFAPFGAVVPGIAGTSLWQGAKAETVDVPQAAAVAVEVIEAPGAVDLAAVQFAAAAVVPAVRRCVVETAARTIMVGEDTPVGAVGAVV